MIIIMIFKIIKNIIAKLHRTLNMTASLSILLLTTGTKWNEELPHLNLPGGGFSSPEGSGAPSPPVKAPHSAFLSTPINAVGGFAHENRTFNDTTYARPCLYERPDDFVRFSKRTRTMEHRLSVSSI
jgi:hypothetical protein